MFQPHSWHERPWATEKHPPPAAGDWLAAVGSPARIPPGPVGRISSSELSLQNNPISSLVPWASLAVSMPKFLYPTPNISTLWNKIHLKNTWKKYHCGKCKSQLVHACLPPWRGRGEDKDQLHILWVSQSLKELLVPMSLTVDDTTQLFVTGTDPSPPSRPQNLPYPDLDQIFQ